MDLSVEGESTYADSGGQPLAAGSPPVVFLHGAALDQSVWATQTRWFAQHGHAVLAPDLPGHGRSQGAPLRSIERMAEWVIALLDAAGVGRASLVGHSMGSLIALQCAARHPQRVERIALLGTAVPMPVSPALLEAARNDRGNAEAMIDAWSRGAPRADAAPPPEAMARLMARAAPGVLANDLAACNDYSKGMEAAAAVRCSALVLAGSHDRMTSPKAAARLAAALGQARLATLEGCGHNMMAEYPDRVRDELHRFLLPGDKPAAS